MSQKKYLVTSTADERDHPDDLLQKGKASALVLAVPASCSRPIKPTAARPSTTRPLPTIRKHR